MPFSEDHELGHIAPKQTMTTAEKFMTVVMLLVLLLLLLNFNQNASIQDQLDKTRATQQAGIIRGYILRAALCDQGKGIGVTEPKSCEAPEIQQYRDPNVVKGSSASARASNKLVVLICSLLSGSKDVPQTVKDDCGKS